MENYMTTFYINRSIPHGLPQKIYETDIDMNRNQGKLELYIKKGVNLNSDYL